MQGVDSLYDCTGRLIVDPRNVAQRIMELRSQVAKGWVEELKSVSEENALIMRETVVSSFSMDDIPVVQEDSTTSMHPDFLDQVDDSAGGNDD